MCDMCGPSIKSGLSATEKAKQKARDDEYRAEDDIRTLKRAEEVRGDAERMANVAKHTKRQISMLTRVARSSSAATGRRRGRRAMAAR